MGLTFVGEWSRRAIPSDPHGSQCGRDYRLKSVVLVEVTFCRFSDSVPDIVMSNIISEVPG
jgi:hypothetical protein